jgi:hypothetical protein
MAVYVLPPYVLGVLLLGWQATAPAGKAADPPRKSPEERFEMLLASAAKDPKKADWKALRHAFAETSHYQPYHAQWRDELGKVGKDIAGGNMQAAEATLTKLLERERFMRLDAQAMAVALYEKTGQKDKALRHRAFLEGLASTVFIPGHGMSFEKPIEVLFIEEEYLLLRGLKVKIKKQALNEHGGHHFDVFTVEAEGDLPERQFYFNIDMPYQALQKSLKGVFDGTKHPPGKK